MYSRFAGLCALLGPLTAGSGRAPRPGNPLPPAVRRAAETIQVTELRRWVGYLASDVLLGRKTPLPGADSAVHYLRRNLPSTRLKPGGLNGDWFQRIPIVMRRLDPSRSFLEFNGERLPFAEYATLTAGPPPRDTTILAPLAYADPARAGAAFDPRGRIVVIERDSSRSTAGHRSARYVFLHGARAILVKPGSEKSPQEKRWDYAPLERRWPFRPVVVGSPALFTRLSTAAALSIHLAGSSDTLGANNLLALLPGRDTTLRNEYVIVGAHYDGQGVTTPVAGDSILNSANDNASGSAALLAIAKAFAAGPRPRRSVIFAWWAGEEGHNLGSGHFARDPVVPTASQVAYVDLDRVGRTTRLTDSRAGIRPCRHGIWPPEGRSGPETLYGPDELDVAGSSTLLDNISRDVNAAYLCMQWNYRAGGGGSDGLDQSVPVLFFAAGNPDAHGLDDTADRLDYRKLSRVAKSVYAVVWAIANSEARPKQDKPRP